MDDFILIANPVSGKGKAKTVAEQAHVTLTKKEFKGDIKLTTGSGDAKQFAQEAISNGIKWVIVCGGDGTLHEAINGIGNTPDVALGLIPAGRGNDLATAVGIPRKPEQAIDILFRGKKRCIDLGYVRSDEGSEHYFSTIATCGYDTEVSRRGSERSTPFSGTASYIYAAIVTLFHYKYPFVRIEADFGTHEGPLLLAATGSTKSYGGGFQIVPNAVYDDGLFDVCVIRPVSKFTVLRLMATLFWGGHTNHPAVDIQQTRNMKIETDPPIMLYADGEPMCMTPATIEIIKHGLTILVP